MVLETGDVGYEVLPVDSCLAHHVQLALHVLADHLADLEGEAVVPHELRLQIALLLVPRHFGLAAGRAERELSFGLGRVLPIDDGLDQLFVELDVAVDQGAILLFVLLVDPAGDEPLVLMLFFLQLSLSVRLEPDLDLAVPGGAMDGLAEHVEDDLFDAVLVARYYEVVVVASLLGPLPEEHRLDRL